MLIYTKINANKEGWSQFLIYVELNTNEMKKFAYQMHRDGTAEEGQRNL